MGATAVIGALRAELSAGIASFVTDMAKSSEAVGGFRERFAKESIKVSKAAGLMAVGVATAWVGMSVAAINAADDLGDAADRIGFTAEQLQEVQMSAKHAGMEIEDTSASLQKFSKNIGEAATGNKLMAASFATLGVSAQDLRNKSPHEIFMTVADAISRIENPSQRLRLTLQLFGKSGGGWVNVFKDGAAGINATAEAARKMGLILSNEIIAKAGKAADELDNMNLVLRMGGTLIGLSLMPAMRAFAGIITDPKFMSAVQGLAEHLGGLIKWMAEHREAVTSVMGAIYGAKKGGPWGALAGAVLGGAAGSKLFQSELDKIDNQIGEITHKIFELQAGKLDTFGQSKDDYLKVLLTQLDEARKKKAELEGTTDKAVAPPKLDLGPVDPYANVVADKTDYDKAVDKIRKRTAALEAQGGAEDRTTLAMERAEQAAQLRAAAEASHLTITDDLTKEIDGLADAYARAAANSDVEKIFDAGQKRIDQARIEGQLIGLTAEEAEARRFAEEQINDILRVRPVTDADMARVDAETEQYRQQLELNRERNVAMSRQIELLDGVRSGLSDMAMAGLKGMSSLKDAAASFLNQLADMILQLYVIKPLIESLLGASGAPGGGILGGLVSAAGSSFSGFFAEGGVIPKGSWGIAGENGPEPVFAGRSDLTVVPNEATHGGLETGGGGLVVNINAPGADAAQLKRVEQAIEKLYETFDRKAVSAVQRVIGGGGARANGFR